MRHLTAEQLVDLAEGITSQPSALHLRSCDACRRQLADLTAAMSMVVEADSPEPSPLFWDHFSARVRGAVEGESVTRVTGLSRLRAVGSMLGVAQWMRPVAFGAVAVLVAVGVLVFQGSRPRPAATSPARASVVVDVSSDTVPLADDPSLALVADLAVGLDWEEAREAGFTTHVGVDDDAVSQLTSGERRELRRLLQREVSPSRRGA